MVGRLVLLGENIKQKTFLQLVCYGVPFVKVFYGQNSIIYATCLYSFILHPKPFVPCTNTATICAILHVICLISQWYAWAYITTNGKRQVASRSPSNQGYLGKIAYLIDYNQVSNTMHQSIICHFEVFLCEHFTSKNKCDWPFITSLCPN